MHSETDSVFFGLDEISNRGSSLPHRPGAVHEEEAENA